MRRLRRFGFNRIKEGFDQLPTAICFFDSRGSIVLCNRQMYRLSHYLFESDMQYLGEVERALANPPEGILQLSNMEGTYRFPDNTIWQFEKTEVTDRYGNGSAGMGEEYCFSGGRTFNRKREIVCQCKKQWCPCADRRKGTTGKCSRDDVCCYAGVSE